MSYYYDYDYDDYDNNNNYYDYEFDQENDYEEPYQDPYGSEMEEEIRDQYDVIEKEFLNELFPQQRPDEIILSSTDEIIFELQVPVIVKLCTLSENRRPCPDLVRLALSHFRGDYWRAIEGLLHGAFPFPVLTTDAPRESRDYATPIRERCLPNNDVLLHVFSFLASDVRCLVSVSSVCRSWRERSAALGQWMATSDLPLARASWSHRLRCGLHTLCRECGVVQREHPCPYGTCKRIGAHRLMHDIVVLEADVQSHKQSMHMCELCPKLEFKTSKSQREHMNEHLQLPVVIGGTGDDDFE